MNNASAHYNNIPGPYSAFDQNVPQPRFDTTAAYSNINQGNLDLNQYQNSHLQQRLAENSIRQQSPAFPHTGYQVNPVVPAKRPRPGEDNISPSPRLPPGSLGHSRSQTPQQQGFQNPYGSQQNGQPYPAPSPYQHLQHANSAHGTPSPVPQNQSFRPQGMPLSRVPTASPHQIHGNNPTMSISNHPMMQNNSNRPQGSQPPPMNQTYMRGMQNSPAFNQNIGTPSNMQPSGMPGMPGMSFPPQGRAQGQMPQQYSAQDMISKQQYLQKLQAAQQQLNSQTRPNDTPSELSTSAWATKQNGQSNSRLNMPNVQMPEVKLSEPSFMDSYAKWMSQRGVPLDPDPKLCGQPISYFQLFMALHKTKVLLPGPNRMKWNMVSSFLNFPEIAFPNAAEEVRQLAEANLATYYVTWVQIMQKRHMQMQHGTGGDHTVNSLQMSPTQLMQPSGPGMDSQSRVNPQAYSQNLQQMGQPTTQRALSIGDGNGPSTVPQTPLNFSNSRPHAEDPGKSNIPAPPHNHVDQLAPTRGPSRPSIDRTNSQTKPILERKPSEVKQVTETEETEYHPRSYTLQNHGGFDLTKLQDLGTQLSRIKANLSAFEDIIDIHSITRSLQSGIHELISQSLDQLILASREPLSLLECDDLLDSLLDCLEEQIDLVKPDSPSTIEDLEFQSFDLLTKASRLELATLTDTAQFASPEYEHEHAVDRIIAISTILRNLSFFDINHSVLVSPPVVAIVCDLLRLLESKAMPMGNSRNTQDVMKDLVTFLSNTADKVELASKEDAKCVLHFLLAFAPRSNPPKDTTKTRSFSSYVPTLHHYLPCAVDSLAKILARDDPNRTFYRSIFQADSSSAEPYALLTAAFGLAISPIPDRTKTYMTARAEIRVSEARKPFFSQGMLAADILASLVPSTDSAIARSWLDSEDGWAPSLLRMITDLAMDRTSMMNQPPRQGVHEGSPFASITHRGLAMLQKLTEKSDISRAEDFRASFNACIPAEEAVLNALIDTACDHQALRQILVFSKLGR